MTETNPVCLDCAQGFHFDCLLGEEGKCCCGDRGSSSGSENEGLSTGLRDGLKWAKSDTQIRDRKSTGRKRAAKLYPIDSDNGCEWRTLLFAGGGLYPIIGCTDGNMKHRHHGPILATTANVEGNVHRICDACHRVWHVCNDAFVKEFMRTVAWLPHDSDSHAPVDILKLASISEKTRIDLSLERFKYKAYKRGRDDYREMLEGLEHSGELINPYLGI